MKLVKYNGGMSPAFRDEFRTIFDADGLFEQLFGKEFTKNFGIDYADNVAYPRVDVVDLADKLILEAEIPGLKKEDVSVEFEDGILSIKGSKKPNLYKDATFVMKEIKKSSFTRTFTLSDELDSEAISADFEDGILTVDIPKKIEVIERVKKRKIL